jgi:hypothetical protein
MRSVIRCWMSTVNMLKSIWTLSVVLAATPAYAHHSFAGFDMEKTQVISGTQVRIDFSAPHERFASTGR